MEKVEKNKEIHTASLSETLQSFEKSLGFKNKIKWNNVIIIVLYHVIGIYWSYKYAFPAKWQTLVFALAMFVFNGVGIGAGVHRLWTHRAFKVNLPFHLILLAAYASAGQNSIYEWVLDHRVHHKYSDTDGDPHNANRGLFFSHIGWLMSKKNEHVLSGGKQIDMSDITDDPLLRFYNKYFAYMKLIFCYILPFYINVYLLGETWQCTIAWQWFIRFLCAFHGELTVNSLAHTFGSRPYNKEIVPTQNKFVSLVTLGEGTHNFHHAFPYDYRSGEQFDYFNFNTFLIDMFSKIGWAYDLRAATPAMIDSVSQRLGDGTRINRSRMTHAETEKE
ncbi:acyl-CoA Delta(11) desaturase-like [Melitaea cinxia]|uniref:acyl-CoA Delta(11) desaturase-like n=1 Tax=Melitaea cinxia TaxID=113334 RepID=UPI001E272060|nr:acyl-CoA Delta(11) desaturase-like [Melitaea cinxia]